MPLLPATGPWRTIANASTEPDPDRRPATVDDLLALIPGHKPFGPLVKAQRPW